MSAILPFGAVPALADDAPPTMLPPVVVGATRLPTPEDQLGGSVTLITADDIERKQRRTLAEVLQDAPGLNLVQTGGPGGSAAIYMRGTNANHTKVLVDGIDVSDPSSTDGSFDFSQILASDIQRVEVLRGPQSGLYGSEAIGGVINIITKTGSGPPKLRASVEGGSFGTVNESAEASGSLARLSYALDVAHFHTDAVQVTPTDLVPAGRAFNPDSNDTVSYSTKLGAGLTRNFDVGVTARYVETRLLATSDDGTGPEGTQSRNDNRELLTRGTAHLVSFDGVLDQTVGVGYTNYRRRFEDPASTTPAPSYFRGDRVKLDWQGNINLSATQVLTLGAEHQVDAINDSNPAVAAMTNDAGFIQLQSSFGKRFFNAISLRYDANDRFGGKPTYRVAPAFLIPETGTKLKGSVGTGFKAPTLDQLFDDYPSFGFFSNPNLVPETSLGYDFGFEQSLLAKRIALGATWFHNDIKNLIDYNDSFTTTINVGRATTRGAETFVSYSPWEQLKLRADYTFTLAENDIASKVLNRRPKHKASLNADWQATSDMSLTATVLYTGAWVDSNRSGTASGLKVNGYTLVNIAGAYDIGHGVTAFARIDNLLDRRYENPLGFQRPGLGVFAGVRLAFDTGKWGDTAKAGG